MEISEATIPEVFIVESLTPYDFRNERMEGDLIKRILSMGLRTPDYRYIRSREEFNDAIRAFAQSRYRYLHLSSHGNATHFQFEFGRMSFLEFEEIIRGKLRDKRLFISACEVVNEDLAKRIMPSSGCYSIIGPYEPIRFDDAAVIWSSYYYLAFKNLRDGTKMDRNLVLKTLRDLTSLYKININYYSKSWKYGIKLTQFLKGKKVEKRLLSK